MSGAAQMSKEFRCVLDARADLGESPIWDARLNVLWWVNILAAEIHAFDPATGEDEAWRAPSEVGSLCVRERGGLVVALATGLHFFDPLTGTFEFIVDPEADVEDNRFNDGKPDRNGRFVAGSMFFHGQPRRSGALYRLDSDLSCHRLVDEIFSSNALAWSPDGTTMFYGDSLAYKVWAWDYDTASGEIANRRLFIDTEPLRSIPDGATVDEHGDYWLTLPEVDRIGRFTSDGELIELIDTPFYHPTCVAFGGPDLDTLFVTAARMFRSPQQQQRQPDAGGIFACRPGVGGLVETRFRG